MNHYWQWLGLVTVCGVLAASYSVLMNRNAQDTQTQQAEQQGYYVKDATIIDTDASGVPQWTLKADNIEQNLSDDSIALRTVSVDYAPEPDKRWLLTAERGYVPPDSRVIEFTGNVAVQPLSPQPHSLVLRTEALRIDTQQSIASTQADVVIEMDRQRLSARGLWADLKRESVRLESSVHGQFNAR